MTLLKGERILLESTNGVLMLTTHRVRHNWGRSCFTSIMLEEVCSVRVVEATFRGLWILGLIMLAAAAVVGQFAISADAAAVYLSRQQGAILLLLVSLMLLVSYFIVRRRIIVIASAGAEITCPSRLFAQRSLMEDFAHALEAAKDDRHHALAAP